MFIAMILLLSMAPAAGAAEPVKNPDTLTYLSLSDADSLDPNWASDENSALVILNIYEPLLRHAGGSMTTLEPVLGRVVPTKENRGISPDGREYVIPIRTGVLFQDGSALTPEDVRYSLLRTLLIQPTTAAGTLFREALLGHASARDDKGALLPGLWEEANRAVTLKDGAVVLRLPRPCAFFLNTLDQQVILSKSWAVKNGDWDGNEATITKFASAEKQSTPFFERANGTGPFQLERWDRKTSEVLLRRNEGYWRKPAALKRVVIRSVPEFITRKLMLLAGDADMIFTDPSYFSQLKNLPGVTVLDGLPNTGLSNVVFFNFSASTVANSFIGSGRLDGEGVPPDFFADRDLRAAFAASFDYDGFIAEVLGKGGAPATGCIPKVLPGHNPNGRSFKMDLENAAALFKKAWGGRVWEKGFKLVMATRSGNSTRIAACQIFKRKIESLNPKFKIDIRVVEWPSLLDAAKTGKLPLFIMGQGGIADAHDFAVAFLHSKGLFPLRQRFSDPAFDVIIEEARSELDLVKRAALYARLQDREHDVIPHVVLAESQDVHVQRDWVKGYVHSPAFQGGVSGAYFYPIRKE